VREEREIIDGTEGKGEKSVWNSEREREERERDTFEVWGRIAGTVGKGVGEEWWGIVRREKVARNGKEGER
jgi:hypothetical protein